MKNLTHRTIFTGVLFLTLTILTSSGAFAAPQPLPFNFPVPSQGDLQWTEIDNDSASCYLDVEDALTIADANDSMGNNDAYDTAWNTLIGGTAVNPPGVGDLTRNTYTSRVQNIDGLAVTYQLFFSEDTQCNRMVMFLDNTTDSSIFDTFEIGTNFGSDEFTTVEGTSSGDTTFNAEDRWVVTSDGEVGTDPINTTVYYGPGNVRSAPTSASIGFCEDVGNIGSAGAAYDIEVPAGESRCMMFFGCLADITGPDNTVSGALDGAELFNANGTIPGDLLRGLTNRELASCLNWDFPSVEPIPTLSEWGMIAMAGLIGIVGFIAVRRKTLVS